MKQMIESLEQLHEKLDTQKIYLIYIFSGLLFFALVFIFLTVPLMERNKALQTKLEQTQTKVKALNIENYEAKTIALKNQQLKQNQMLEEKRDSFVVDLSKLKSFKFINYSTQNLTAFLDLVMKSSLQNSLSIKSVENEKISLDEKVSFFTNKIKITGEGKYLDVVKYLHILMEFKALKKLEEFEVYIDETNNLEFNILFNFGGEQ